MKELDFFKYISSKQHYEGAIVFKTAQDNNRMTLGNSYTLATLVRNGKYMPIEKHSDTDVHILIFLSAATYALTQDQIDHVMGCDELEREAWLLGYTRSS